MKLHARPLVTLFAHSIAALGASFALLATAHAEAPAAAPKGDAQRGATAAAACQACHTADGSRGANTFPILQGQHPQYTVKQLMDFKKGDRKNSIMNGMAAQLTEQQMLDIAAFYASKEPKPGAAQKKDLVRLGERIYRGGIPAKKVPACAACHSPTGAGMPAQYPRLAGQHVEYTQAQLVNFRAGKDKPEGRTNSAQMMAIAANLSDKEIEAVSDYIAGLR